MIEGWAMLEHRRSPAAKVCEGTIPVLSGGPSVGRTGIASGAPNGRALPGVAGLTSRPKIAAPAWTARDRRGKPVAVPSLLLQAARFFRAHPAIGHIAAVALIGFATALQWVARDLYQGAPFLTIYPAIVLTAFIGGYRAGLLSALLAGLSQWYLFIPEYNLFAVVSYALDAILCVGLIEYINRSLEKETLAKEHQRLLKDELHHRMQNLFAVIQSVIRFSLPDGKCSGVCERRQGSSVRPAASDVRRQPLCRRCNRQCRASRPRPRSDSRSWQSNHDPRPALSAA
jgi:hypothetical protein